MLIYSIEIVEWIMELLPCMTGDEDLSTSIPYSRSSFRFLLRTLRVTNMGKNRLCMKFSPVVDHWIMTSAVYCMFQICMLQIFYLLSFD